MFANLHAWWTVALLVTFIGIVIWAYSSSRKQAFDEAARLALDDDDNDTPGHARKDGNAHG